jgi:hypothetical protein
MISGQFDDSTFFSGSWMEGVTTPSDLVSRAMAEASAVDAMMRVFNLLHPPKTVPKTQGDEEEILGIYGKAPPPVAKAER